MPSLVAQDVTTASVPSCHATSVDAPGAPARARSRRSALLRASTRGLSLDAEVLQHILDDPHVLRGVRMGEVDDVQQDAGLFQLL